MLQNLLIHYFTQSPSRAPYIGGYRYPALS